MDMKKLAIVDRIFFFVGSSLLAVGGSFSLLTAVVLPKRVVIESNSRVVVPHLLNVGSNLPVAVPPLLNVLSNFPQLLRKQQVVSRYLSRRYLTNNGNFPLHASSIFFLKNRKNRCKQNLKF